MDLGGAPYRLNIIPTLIPIPFLHIPVELDSLSDPWNLSQDILSRLPYPVDLRSACPQLESPQVPWINSGS